MARLTGKHTILWFTLLLTLFFSVKSVNAQDIHFSQFDYTPLQLNPALTGIFKGDARFTGNFRSQWYTVPVDYMTFSGAVDFKVYDKNLINTLFAGGLLIDHDNAGFGNLSQTRIGLSASVTQRISTKNFLTLGAQFSAHNRSIDLDGLTFGNQFNGEQFDADLDSRENFEQTSFFYPGVAVGLNWHHQVPERRTRFDIGVGMHNFHRPEVSFFNDETVKLWARYAFYGMGSFSTTERLDVVLKLLGQIQGPHQEIVGGGGLRYYFDPEPTRPIALQIGAGYRLDDAFFPEVHVFYGPWIAGLSYDVNISEFQAATNEVGGIELSLVYIFTKVRPVPLKICPIF